MLQKTLLAVAVGLVGVTFSHPSPACGRCGVGVVNQPISVSDQAADLRAQADRMDARAVANDRTATMLTQEGDALLVRARTLRQQAMNVSDIDRDSLLARAEAISAQAAADMSQASQLRSEAMQLRSRARALRDRAIQLVGGGGWRKRAPAVDVAF
jgi:hypothetical protein